MSKDLTPFPPNKSAQALHGIRMVPHAPTRQYRAALVEQLQRDSINGKGGQQDRVELHNAAKKLPRPDGDLDDD